MADGKQTRRFTKRALMCCVCRDERLHGGEGRRTQKRLVSPTPARDPPLLLHLQAMRRPAGADAHWRPVRASSGPPAAAALSPLRRHLSLLTSSFSSCLFHLLCFLYLTKATLCALLPPRSTFSALIVAPPQTRKLRIDNHSVFLLHFSFPSLFFFPAVNLFVF